LEPSFRLALSGAGYDDRNPNNTYRDNRRIEEIAKAAPVC